MDGVSRLSGRTGRYVALSVGPGATAGVLLGGAPGVALGIVVGAGLGVVVGAVLDQDR